MTIKNTPGGTRGRQAGALYGKMIAGSLWAIAMRWSMRFVGLASIVVLARLLTPQDFGVVAMGAIAVGLIEVFAELGSSTLLLREREVSRLDCDTAWTVRVMQGCLVATILVTCAPLAAAYFAEPRVVPVLWVLAAGCVISSFENVGLVLVRRELDFARDFRIGIYQKLSVAGTTVILALWLRSYWALVFGQLVGSIASCAISYILHPYRPRFCVAKIRRYLSFSFSMVLMNVAYFLRERIGVIAVGGGGNGTSQLGAYNVANEIAMMAVRETVIPLWRGLFPSFAKLGHDLDEFREAHVRLVACVALVSLPLGFGTAAVAEHLVATLLGPAWRACVPLMQWLGIASALIGLMQVLSGSALVACKKERVSAYLMWFQIALIVPSSLVAGRVWGAEAVAMAAALSMLIALPVEVEVLRRTIGFQWSTFTQVIWRPACGVAAMVAWLHLLPDPVAWPAWIRLLLEAVSGGAVYCATVVVLWFAAGRPDGAEQSIWQLIDRSKARLGFSR